MCAALVYPRKVGVQWGPTPLAAYCYRPTLTPYSPSVLPTLPQPLWLPVGEGRGRDVECRGSQLVRVTHRLGLIPLGLFIVVVNFPQDRVKRGYRNYFIGSAYWGGLSTTTCGLDEVIIVET